jgi:tRNA threonylcarbamoyladenosine biosynthesis protein TsaE
MNTEEGRSRDRWTVLSRSAEETEQLGRVIGTCVEGGDIVALYGELGTGKTTLVRGVAAGIGASPAVVSSPTFVLIREYHGRLRLAHADLYRISSALDLHHSGLTDYFDHATVTILEWAEKATGELPLDRLEIHFSHRGQTTRNLRISYRGPRAHRLLGRIRTAMAPVDRHDDA